MFGELPKLFGRNFAMAFFLPMALTMILGVFTLNSYIKFNIVSWFLSDLATGTTVAGLLCWIGSVSLLVTNRELYRLLEGYGRANPIRLLAFLERRRYQRLQQKITTTKNSKREYITKKEPVPDSLLRLRSHLEGKLVEEFPDKNELLLPTAFGNTMRAFETYPRVMYGIEGVDGWDRLLAVIPQNYRGLIDDAKSQVDFWVNLGFLGAFLYIANIYFIVTTNNLSAPLLFLLVMLIALIAPLRARRAAAEWGSLVKSAFDIFLPALGEKLGIKACNSPMEEADQWVSFSQAVIYRLPKNMSAIKKQSAQQIKKQPPKKD